jgi:hypothetical protein
LRKCLTQSYCTLKVLEDVSRGNAQVASGCSREEAAAAAEDVEVVEEVVEVVVVVEMVVEMVAAETTGVETMVVMTVGVMKRVGMMVVKTEGYDKKGGKIRENRKSKGRNLNKRIHKKMRKNLPLSQNLKHGSHIASKSNPFPAGFLLTNL